MTLNKQYREDKRLISPNAIGIQEAAKVLEDGALVAFPTETVYGLGADATNDEAIARIFSAKNRPEFNPLIVHVHSIQSAFNFVKVTPIANLLAQSFWPGPLTLVLKRANNCPFSLLVSAGLDSIAIRVPSNFIALNLLSAVRIPIAAPSANLSGKISPTKPEHVLEEWPQKTSNGPQLVIDGGNCSIGIESTVVDVTSNQARILRPGGITIEELESRIGPLANTEDNIKSTLIKSPGMLSKHYAPSIPVYLNSFSPELMGAYLGFGEDVNQSKYNLSRSADLVEAASNLFALLRLIDNKNYSSVSIAPIPKIGLGIAINNRLNRAANRNET